jgi:hypothetical protein
MYEFTNGLCDCDFSVYSCCDAGYCAIAEEWARMVWNVKLTPISGAKLPFMGEKGCIVPPHLRPLCTVHICEKFLLDQDRSTKYTILRQALEDLEWGLHRDAMDAVIHSALERSKKDF